MATLAPGGRITTEIVDEEIARLRVAWQAAGASSIGSGLLDAMLPSDRLADIDAFDRVQLEEVVRVSQTSPSLSEAGRRLFAVSRARKAAPNDADRLRKYLARFGLDWKTVREARS
jgi:transcriptional regulatory protein RtcR